MFILHSKLCSDEKQNSFDAKHDHSTKATVKCSQQRHPLPLPKQAHIARFVWFCRQSSTSCCDKMAVGTSTSLPAQHIAFVRRKRDEGNKHTVHDALLSHAKTARTHALFKLTVQAKTTRATSSCSSATRLQLCRQPPAQTPTREKEYWIPVP